ncbi:hypothetical protein R75461_07680 [Paraburkholderia nemoris]|uniref:hypothetical protein n=1 Tax=Paraburkholderia nemoris TaxID=2793076 RepID=UPI00190BF733|nr:MULTISPECIES: hypothetical protein [Paraburkholderia]MBK3786442.1 hypothetical protein [Paraburkholderia aspalathi]CAE6855370.1 hypothetical protein R75461_07680 [Paraburkholderia nemoris]
MPTGKPVTVADYIAKWLTEQLEPHADAIEKGTVFLEELSKKIHAAAENVAAHLQGPLVALSKIDWDDVKRRLDSLPEKSKSAMILAASRGWFFGWNDSLEGVLTLVEKLDVADSNDVDDILVEYHRQNFESSVRDLIERHPKRAAVITAAVQAHNTSTTDGYFLSIPIFIAQADGLLSEISDLQSPLSAKGLKALRASLEDDLESANLLYPLLILGELDFLKGAAERKSAAEASGQAFTALNRHQVMHGESWDYGSEINSLKAFSFLLFVGVHLPLIRKEKSDSENYH